MNIIHKLIVLLLLLYCRLWYYSFYVLHSIFSLDKLFLSTNFISISNVNTFSNNNNELFNEQYLLITMTVCIPKRDRCRLCFSLILRDRSTLFSSICCQKYYHLFKHIQRTKIPIKKYNPFKITNSNRTVCFRDLILRYLHTEIDPIQNFSNFICYDCSRILLDIEQCAKYLRKTTNQLKIKFNKSNRLVTSSLSATIQKKKQMIKAVKIEQLPIINSDEDEEFDDIDDEEVRSIN